MTHLLEVQDLVVKFGLRSGDLTALNGINFTSIPANAWDWWANRARANPWPDSPSST